MPVLAFAVLGLKLTVLKQAFEQVPSVLTALIQPLVPEVRVFVQLLAPVAAGQVLVSVFEPFSFAVPEVQDLVFEQVSLRVQVKEKALKPFCLDRGFRLLLNFYRNDILCSY